MGQDFGSMIDKSDLEWESYQWYTMYNVQYITYD